MRERLIGLAWGFGSVAVMLGLLAWIMAQPMPHPAVCWTAGECIQ
jgi:hypothetical protein